MDLASIFLFCLISCVIGAVLMLLIQYYAFVRYLDAPGETDEQKLINEKYILPDSVLLSIKTPDAECKNPITAFNLIFQFLFYELRNSNKVRKWFYRKLSLELDELISKTTIGKLFDKLSIRELDLGGQFPEIKNIRVHNADLHDTEGHIESTDLLLDLLYNGNFRLSIDADMVLGKKGFLSVKVKHISGLARLQFTRKPYTHWSLCFLGDPKVELDIETQFQGRQMQSNVTSLIVNQIRKAIRRKHTLPNYKMRYKPFFHKTDDEPDITDIVLDGTLDINVAELSRLIIPNHINHVYCTITLSPIPWVVARQFDERSIIVSLDVEIHKAKNQQIGIVFKQSDGLVTIDNIIPNTPATKAKLRRGDQLVSIEGKTITNINHIAKIIKRLNRPIFRLRIERVMDGQIRPDQPIDDPGLMEDFNDCNITFSKLNDSVQIGMKPSVRQNSIDRTGQSSDSSRSNTPTGTPRKGGEKISKINRLNRCNSDSKSGSDESKSQLKLNDQVSNEAVYQQHVTIDCLVNSMISVNDLSQFSLNENCTWINLNIFGRCNDQTILLAYLNIPTHYVLAESLDSNLSHLIKQYPLSPPDTPNLSTHQLSSLSGFDPNLCFGDVLLSFGWSGSVLSTPVGMDINRKLNREKSRSISERRDDDRSDQTTKSHDFVRTHFQRATQCDYCGKKIWLKDAEQCRDCGMSCHKKCINKCQMSTICGPIDGVTLIQSAVELKVTGTDDGENDDFDDDEARPKLEQHRQSFSDLISQGLKRVNSANNLSIPGMSGTSSPGSKSLPPTPQHTPRKQSLVNQSTNPFVVVTYKLEQFPESDIQSEQIAGLTEPLIGWGTPDELMGLAKTSSRSLYSDYEPKERVDKINELLTKLRLALDIETTSHANLSQPIDQPKGEMKSDAIRTPSDTNLLLQTRPPVVQHEQARRAFLIGQSEERVQALSVIMLHLCTGLQYAQGVASQ